MELYKKEKNSEEKDSTIRSLMNENKLLIEKSSALETDLKVILNNRSKLDNLEDVIVKFLKDDQDKNENYKSLLMSNNNPNMTKSINYNNNTNMMSHNNPNLISPSSNQAGIYTH